MFQRTISRLIGFILAVSFLLPVIGVSADVGGPNPYLLRDINDAISAGSDPYWLMPAGETTYFFVKNSAGISEFWKTDGSPEGTKLVKAGLMFGASDYLYKRTADPGTFTLYKNKFFFLAKESEGPGLLWQTNGTTSGTQKVLFNGSTIPAPTSFRVMNNLLYYLDNEKNLYSFDGTVNGIHLIANLYSVYSDLIIFSNNFYIITRDWDNNKNVITKIEINPPAPQPSINLDISENKEMIVYHDNLFIAAREANLADGAHGYELWKMTNTGDVRLVADINIYGDSNPGAFWIFDDFLFFSADDGSGIKLWRTDGTEPGTTLVQNLNPDPNDPITYRILGAAGSAQDFAERLIFASFSTARNDLWATDGTSEGTIWLSNTEKDDDLFSEVLGDRLFYQTSDDTHGLELWQTDGTPAGTQLIKDIWAGRRGSNPTVFTQCGSRICFVASDGIYGEEVWTSDGTLSGTKILRDFNIAAQGSDPWGFTQAGKQVFFIANDHVSNSNLWRTDGSQEGTIVLNSNPDVSFTFPYSSDGSGRMPTIGSEVYLIGSDPVHGAELWRSDGSSEGTGMVKDINPGVEGSGPGNMIVAGDLIYFIAYNPLTDWELWVSDGSEIGTHLVKDLIPKGNSSMHIYAMSPLGKSIIFFLFDYMSFSYSQGLWISDGTEAGTHQISIFERWGYYTVQAGGKVFFSGSYSSAMPERIFVTDGTLNGTKPVSDTVTFYYVEALFGAGNRVFISEHYDEKHYLLYSFDVDQNGFGIIHPLFDKGMMGETLSPQCIGYNGRLGCTIGSIDSITKEFGEVFLWMSDGTITGSRMVDGNFSQPGQLVFSGPELSFTADVIGEGRQIWVTDGTVERTRQLSHFSEKMCGTFSLIYMNYTYFLPLNDSGNNPEHGCELWALNMSKPRAFLPVITR